MVKFLFPKIRIPIFSLCSEILDAECIKFMLYMLAWDALKKVNNCQNKKSGASIRLSHFFRIKIWERRFKNVKFVKRIRQT